LLLTFAQLSQIAALFFSSNTAMQQLAAWDSPIGPATSHAGHALVQLPQQHMPAANDVSLSMWEHSF
jgi:hypothetical protein